LCLLCCRTMCRLLLVVAFCTGRCIHHLRHSFPTRRSSDLMEKAIRTLNEVKESIINAYAFKTGLTHSRIAKLMENETWMNAKKAVELGFADEILFEAVEPEEDPDEEAPDEREGDTEIGRAHV